MRKHKLTFRPLYDIVQRARRRVQTHDAAWMRFVRVRLPWLDTQNDHLTDASMVRHLSGILSPKMSVDDYRAHLEEKYGTAHPAETSR